MSLKDIYNKLIQVDKIMDYLERMLKKHWLLILLSLITWFFYWALTSPTIMQDAPEQTIDTMYQDSCFEPLNQAI